MKKRWLTIFTMLGLMFVLTACTSENSITDTDEGNNNNSDTVETDENEGNLENDEDSASENIASDEDGADSEDAENDESKDNGEAANEQEEFLNAAQLIESDEQDYSIYLLPEYTLTSEEPGRDSLYLDEDGSIFMRIETMLAEDGTYDYLLENMQAILEASSSNGAAPEQLNDGASLPSGESIENVKAYSVDSETGPVTGIIFERDGMIVRLTMFDSLEANYFDQFLAMGETVTKTN